jgi:hypothetical protein
MCDACERSPSASPATADHANPSGPSVDRRTLLRRAGIGGVTAVALATLLPDALADAMAPPFESVQLGEDRLKAVAPTLTPAALPAAGATTTKRSTPAPASSAPAIVTRAEWGADESIATRERGFAPIRKFIVHHTDSANNPKNPAQVMRDMYRYHVIGRGFSDVGYNFAIDHRGTIYEGRWARHYGPGERHDGEDGGGFGVVGAHALGVNAGSCGIVLMGDFTKAKPTSAALGSLIQLISWKASLHQVDPLDAEEYISIFGMHRTFPNIAGHRQTGQTVCPGPLLFKQLPWIRGQVAARTGRFPARTIDMSKALRWTDPSALPAGFEPGAEAVAATAAPATPAGSKLTGYRVLTADGRVVTLGKAPTLGSPRDVGLGAVSAIAGVPGRSAYLTAGSSGKVVGFGGAAGGAPKTAVPTADVAATPSGQGYWVLSSSGGVYAFGSAKHYGSLSRSGVGSAGVKIRSTPSGKGYWILAANGRIYAFGDAPKLSTPSLSSVADFWPTPSGAGYWVLLADGRVAAYGDASHFGDIPSLKTKWTKPAVAIVGMPSGRGYAIAVRDGGVFNFGSSPFLGSLAGSRRQIVGMALAFG